MSTELNWHTSSRTGTNGNCVEVAPTCGGGALVRDTKDRPTGHFAVASRGWHAFLTEIKHGRFDN